MNERTKTVLFNSTKELCYLAVGIALYVALSMTMKIPLISHISTDLGYIIFGVFLVLFGWKGLIVGTIGCILESIIFNGWFPLGWALGQVAIGLICGISFKLLQKVQTKWLRYTLEILITALACAIGILGIKTIVECNLYSIPYAVKLAKNGIACIADFVPMVIGVLLAESLREKKFFQKITQNA